jgi:hypothetical protein
MSPAEVTAENESVFHDGLGHGFFIVGANFPCRRLSNSRSRHDVYLRIQMSRVSSGAHLAGESSRMAARSFVFVSYPAAILQHTGAPLQSLVELGYIQAFWMAGSSLVKCFSSPSRGPME